MIPAPKYVLRNLGCARQRDFKSLKRQQVKELRRNIEEVSRGCAFSPAYDELTKARNLIRAAEEKQSVEKWGR